jgi:mRNA interferase MazF
MRRGEVWWAELPPPVRTRPVVLLGPEDGLPRDGVADLDTVTTISKAALSRPLATRSPVKLRAINRALRFALGLD